MAEFEGKLAPPQHQSDPVPVQRRVDLVAPTPTALPEPTAPTLADFAPDRAFQRQIAQPVLQATGQLQDLKAQRQTQQAALQRQVAETQANLPAGAEQAAVHRQAARSQPATIPVAFQRQASGKGFGITPGIGDWAGLYSHQMGQHTPDRQGMYPAGPVKALQRQVATGLAQTVRTSSLPPVQRYAEVGQALATIQRQPLGGAAAHWSLGQMPPGERPVIQRALDDANLALQRQAAEDAQVDHLHSLQRQLEVHQAQSDQAQVMQRIRERQGSGHPLPAAVQRHMERGLNTDLSGVRIHTDSEAHLLSKQAGATAFTSGKDVYFQRSTFDPNSQSGLELLGHELTHVKQQSQGRVGGGIDPDAGLEAEAQRMGANLANGRLPAVQRAAAPEAPDQSSATSSPVAGPTVQRQAAPATSQGTPTPDAARLAHFRQLMRDYQALVQSGELTTEERAQVDQAVQRAQAAIRRAEQVQGRGQGAAQAAGVGLVGIGGLVADDATVVGVADDVLIPFVGLFVLGALALSAMRSSSDADKLAAWNAANAAVTSAVGTIEGVLAHRRGQTETRSRAEPRVIPRTRDDEEPDSHRGRLQVQGTDLRAFPNGELSWAWTRPAPPTAVEALAAVQAMKVQLSARQLQVRIDAFNKAERVIQTAPAQGGITAPFVKSYQNQNLPRDLGSARVDIEVRKGKAFV